MKSIILAAPKKKRIEKLLTSILKQLGKDQSLIKYVADRKGHDRRYSMDSSKISRELGWRPTVSFDEGIQKTIEWYLQNEQKNG